MAVSLESPHGVFLVCLSQFPLFIRHGSYWMRAIASVWPEHLCKGPVSDNMHSEELGLGPQHVSSWGHNSAHNTGRRGASVSGWEWEAGAGFKDGERASRWELGSQALSLVHPLPGETPSQEMTNVPCPHSLAWHWE